MAISRKHLAAGLLMLLQACSSKQPPFNIIHITADDLGYGELGSFGQKLVLTPNLDQLATEGMRFTQHYAGSSLCNPSRYAFMTGKHAGSTRVVTNRSNILPAETFTIAKLMQNSGYSTGIIGKWALGSASSSGGPLKQGFDYFFGYANQVAAHNYYPEQLVENDNHVNLEGNTLSEDFNIAKDKKVYAPELIHQKSLAFVERNRHRKFYLQLDYNLPHVNNELQKITANGFEHPGIGRYSEENWSMAEKSYAEVVSLMDDYVGELIWKLRSLGLGKKTLVIFTSDNGPTGERSQESLQRFNATGSLKGMKGMLFEGGIRVPMIAWWPGTVPGKASHTNTTTFWDVMPTLAELIDYPQALETDGESFASALRGLGHESIKRVLYWEIGDRKALRSGSWKWVHHPMKSKSEFLYNIVDDPDELTNLAARAPEKLAQLKSMAERYTTMQ